MHHYLRSWDSLLFEAFLTTFELPIVGGITIQLSVHAWRDFQFPFKGGKLATNHCVEQIMPKLLRGSFSKAATTTILILFRLSNWSSS